MIRAVAFCLTVAVAALPAQSWICTATGSAGYDCRREILGPSEPLPEEGAAQTIKRTALPAQITVSAIHQPPAALASQTGRVSRGIAVYEVVACGSGTISTAEIRQRFAREKLRLLAPVLGTVTAERERARGVLGVISSIPDLAPLAALALSTSGAPGAAKIGGAAVSAIVAGWHAAHSPRPVPFLDKGVITITGGCESYLAYAYWPRRGGIQSVEFTRVQ